MRTATLLAALLFAPLLAEDAPKADAPKTSTLEVLDAGQGRRLALVRVIASSADFQSFQRDVQNISAEQKDTALTKQLLDAALTSPEKEARQRQLDTKLKKLNETNTSMSKTYGFDLTRQYLVVPTKVGVYQVLSDDEYIKLAATSDFKKDSVIEADGKKLLAKGTVTGAVEVESFQMQARAVAETKQRLQQLLDLQPKLTDEKDKKKVQDAIQRAQGDVNEALANFSSSQKYAFSDKLATQIAEAKLYVLLSEEENKAVDKAVNEAKKDAPAAK